MSDRPNLASTEDVAEELEVEALVQNEGLERMKTHPIFELEAMQRQRLDRELEGVQAEEAHDLQPGSVVVMSVDRRIAAAERVQIEADFTALLPEGVTGMVLLEGTQITDVLQGG